jgi:hypothetical protein
MKVKWMVVPEIPLGPFKSFLERISLKALDREEAEEEEEVAKYMSSCTTSTVLSNKKPKLTYEGKKDSASE